MAAMFLAVLLLEQNHCNLHKRMVEVYLFQFDCWFIPPACFWAWGLELQLRVEDFGVTTKAPCETRQDPM